MRLTNYPEKPPLGSVIDWGNPVTKNMVSCFLINDGGGRYFRDLVLNDLANHGTISWRKRDFGCAAAVYAQTVKQQAIYNFTDRFTISAWVYFKSLVSYGCVIGKGNGGTSSGYYLRIDNASHAFGRWYDQTPTNIDVTSSNTIPTLKPVHMVLVNNASTLDIWLNGVRTQGPSTSGKTLTTNSNVFTFGCDSYAAYQATRYLDGDLINVMVWGRDLKPAEIMRLYQNPYHFVRKMATNQHFFCPVGVTLPTKQLTLSKNSPTVVGQIQAAVELPTKQLTLSKNSPTIVGQLQSSIELPTKQLTLSKNSPTAEGIETIFTKTINIKNGITGSHLGGVLFNAGDGTGVNAVDSPFEYGWKYGTYPITLSKNTFGDLAFNLLVENEDEVTWYLYQNTYFNTCRTAKMYRQDIDSLTIEAWLEINGALFPTVTSCDINIFEAGGDGTPVLALTSSTLTAKYTFHFEQTAPTGLDANKLYIMETVINAGAQSYTTYDFISIDPTTQTILDIEKGKWEVVGNQMIFYKPDNTTEICRFNLFDSSGSPTSTAPVKRVKV